VGLVPLLLKSNSASLLVEDYAACLELRSEGCQLIENISDELGVPGWNDGFSSLENVGGKRVTVVEQVNDFIASTYGIPHTITST
nr:nuclear pore complex protein NUP205 [Tanacetum cinerariifolium]